MSCGNTVFCAGGEGGEAGRGDRALRGDEGVERAPAGEEPAAARQVHRRRRHVQHARRGGQGAQRLQLQLRGGAGRQLLHHVVNHSSLLHTYFMISSQIRGGSCDFSKIISLNYQIKGKNSWELFFSKVT